MSAERFEVRVSQEVLDDLQDRLARTRWLDEWVRSDWSYGVNLDYLKQLVQYWRDQFDWRAQELALNRLSHYRAHVDDLCIHFIHERSRNPSAIPLILTHGWPDSFIRVLKVIPMLTDPGAHGADPGDAFHVVVPSLPGFGFSDKPKTPGTTARIADYWAELMTQLGYARFAAGGGDLGGAVSQELGQTYPERLIGLHLTDVPSQTTAFFDGDPISLSEVEREYLAQGQVWVEQEGAYEAIQSRNPLTAACGLNDSPVGLAAWILDKFYAWSDCGGDLESCFNKDELLANVMIYWVTGTIGSSFLYYYEPVHGHLPRNLRKRVDVPTAFAMFPKDLNPAPRKWAERFFNVFRWTEMPRGGHFAALEQPDLLVEDIRAFFRPLRRPL